MKARELIDTVNGIVDKEMNEEALRLIETRVREIRNLKSMLVRAEAALEGILESDVEDLVEV